MDVIQPNWDIPKHIQAFTTLRKGGESLFPFDSFNLGDHVGDDPVAVANNRKRLVIAQNLPNPPLYLTQTHSTRVITLPYSGNNLEADAVYTNQINQVCLVMTADCLPVLFCNKDGTEVAAAHAGWRGLCDGILEETVKKFHCSHSEISVWLAPAISQKAFQVGKEVVDQFCNIDPNAVIAFTNDPHTKDKYYADLYQLAAQRLNKLGITQISGGKHCTYTEKDKFFSYRRDGKTGRIATLIWINPNK
ncbi:peptidoglycan editing factor PgeF [Pasteurella skyensis]|uniref:Purine nucleoside phosphorylase n=1 Tax=Phocoenobacter skyensis TaxID=97481 RepID=A0AAJ6N921_9PAST|nr:peptidoglycan editing factor PgeF [Pasteurella skyensis]MDP8162455.1 peptidoglycan editing factor PgeF [Pasteurella skyensis]MDP8172420.1 peptidoglycan editing factor PgeF [Pasteurella skyensis]MDP8177445.1 peptidoglycan editing factor PgeF [Pasteurella skyensis]MDP8178675.1 peptidoglycan editing factor PgeF [Pasteurella skyensis]MDP8183035.1 peptidoglycan editing factor PgeF [Pasteurella skyensis]